MINLTDFRKIYENKNCRDIPMSYPKIQKFYARIYFENNNNKTNLNLRKNFKEDTGY